MKRSYLFLLGLVGILFFSCNKNDDNNDDNDPPATPREWFKLKTILNTRVSSGSSTYRDSTDIQIDSVKNKIVFKQYGQDTSTEVYTYNSKYQLELYEHIDTYDRLYISRMQFVRNADGQLTKVLSEYKNSLIATSEGTVKYDKRGDTTFITFLDSVRKHPQGYPDAQDYYQVALINDRIVYSKDYAIKSTGQSDSSIDKFEYDAAGNLTSDTYQNSKSTPVVYTYQWGGEQLKDLQKFMTQWTGDLVWFSRAKLFFFTSTGYGNSLAGNVLQSIKKDNVAYMSFTNGFDANGNLSSISYKNVGGAVSYTYTKQYKYRP